MIKIVFKYLMSYILPIPIYLILFVVFTGINASLLRSLGSESEFINYSMLIIENSALISSFNYLVYKNSLKHIEEEKAKKIFNGLKIFNFILLISIVVFIKVAIMTTSRKF